MIDREQEESGGKPLFLTFEVNKVEWVQMKMLNYERLTGREEGLAPALALSFNLISFRNSL